MKTLEQDRLVEALTQQLSDAWRSVLEEPASAQVDEVLNALDRARQELVARDATLPTTLHRREWVEALQSEMQEVEVLLENFTQNTGELIALAARQVETTERALDDAPPTQRRSFDLSGPAVPELTVLVIFLAATFTRWPSLLLASAGVVMIFAGGAGRIPRLDLRFDGRALRIVRHYFWLPCWSSTIDLAEVHDVVLAPGRVTLTSLQGGLEFATRGLERERLAAQLREWCTCAARERC